MNPKIEFYQEVLQIEPGSRIFFPLAKLLAKENRADEAIATLQKGIVGHQDHVEARLFLVELCFLHGKQDLLNSEIQNLGKLFKMYPKFWEAWSHVLSQTQELQDAALALRFFAAAIAGKDLSWAKVIAHGLRDVLGSAVILPTELKTVQPDDLELPDEIDDTEEAELEKGETTLQIPHALAPVKIQAEDLETEDQKLGEEEREDSPEEGFSLRTKSMADVLAEQGDYSGALDIYQELIEAGQGDIPALQERVEDLRALMHNPAAAAISKDEPASEDGDKNRLVNLLESLAERLETRSRSGL